jgi:exoribonuclease R
MEAMARRKSWQTFVGMVWLFLLSLSSLPPSVSSWSTNDIGERHLTVWSQQQQRQRGWKERARIPTAKDVSLAATRRGVTLGRQNKQSSASSSSPAPSNADSSHCWFPRRAENHATSITDDDDDADEDDDDHIEQQAVQLAAKMVKRQLLQQKTVSASSNPQEPAPSDSVVAHHHHHQVPKQVQGRFRDLTCQEKGELILENMFLDYHTLLGDQQVEDYEDSILAATVMVFQSLLVYASQVGLTGPPEQLRRLVAHLDDRIDPDLAFRDLQTWDIDSIRRLKYRIDRTPATQLLAALLYKRTAQGAFDLLVAMGIFTKHEDLALLRSGFPLRFSTEEKHMAENIAKNPKADVDSLLNLRQDLRHLKVYTIDSASTTEIDDGLSVEVIEKEGGKKAYRYWIHIADSERHTSTELWDQVARKRFTSLYLPTGSIPMFPHILSANVMSLTVGNDVCALSMGLELNDDGASINPDSIVLSPSTIRVDYRLTYDDVDEMLSEGVGYLEEWELGALLDMAKKRRAFRINNGSSEGLVPRPIPFPVLETYSSESEPDGIGISHSIDVSHNSGKNETVNDDRDNSGNDYFPVSSSNLLVTEAMILAGEGIDVWKTGFDTKRAANEETKSFPNSITLPYRTQAKPDFKSRGRERRELMKLQEDNAGGGYCYAWYARRFLQSVKVVTTPSPHSGLALSAYVQWSSPIRRFSDLMTHRMIKRGIRRQRVYEMVVKGEPIPVEVTDNDLGFPDGTLQNGALASTDLTNRDLDNDTNVLEGAGLQGAARTLQRNSEQYCMFEFIRRLHVQNPDKVFSATVLGIVEPEKNRFAIYLEELALEHRYTALSPSLEAGTKLRLRVDSVNPRFGLLTFVRVF